MSASLTYVLRAIIIVLLLGCLAKMPYGYFQFVRLSTFIMFLVLAFQQYEKKQMLTMLMCIGFAILLNPIFRVHFTRFIWNAIDVGIACCIAVWLIIDITGAEKSKNDNSKI